MIRQREPIKRSTVPIPHKRKKPRKVSVTRDQDYMDWLKGRKCIACFIDPGYRKRNIQPFIAGMIDPAHTIGNGGSSKGPDSSCIPLCRHHHDEMDGRLSTAITTKAAFAAKYGLDLAKEAAAHYALFKAVGDEFV